MSHHPEQETRHCGLEVKEGKKERFTTHLPVDLIDRIRDAVYWIPGMTLTRFAEIAFSETLARWERHRGRPYPSRRGALKVGRPIQ